MYQYEAEVLKVVDGDTVDLLVDLGFNLFIKERFRLYGVNTPESRTKDKEEKKLGLAAKSYVESRIKGKKVKVDITKGKGKYGRYLASIFYSNAFGDAINLNQALILDGHAKEYYGGKR